VYGDVVTAWVVRLLRSMRLAMLVCIALSSMKTSGLSELTVLAARTHRVQNRQRLSQREFGRRRIFEARRGVFDAVGNVHRDLCRQRQY
jgi:hypothetical protein